LKGQTACCIVDFASLSQRKNKTEQSSDNQKMKAGQYENRTRGLLHPKQESYH
jgi:hypothetical protein